MPSTPSTMVFTLTSNRAHYDNLSLPPVGVRHHLVQNIVLKFAKQNNFSGSTITYNTNE